jgi:hypothetical protein
MLRFVAGGGFAARRLFRAGFGSTPADLRLNGEQQQFLHAAEHSPRNLALVGGGGTGKTCVVARASFAVPGAQKLLLAHNTIMKNELALAQSNGSLCPSWTIKTWYGLGYDCVKAHGKYYRRNVSTGPRKLKTLVKQMFSKRKRATRGYMKSVVALCAKAKVAGMKYGPYNPSGGLLEDSLANWAALIERFRIPVPEGVENRELIRDSRKLLHKSNAVAYTEANFDFDDHIYLPVLYGLPLPQFDAVLVEECHDMNAMMRLFLGRLLLPGGRVIGVGDSYASVFQFRDGGHADRGIAPLVRELDMQTISLHTSYRCSAEIVKHAQKLVGGYLQADARGERGSVQTLGEWRVEDLRVGDVIVSRRSQPLMRLVFRLLRINADQEDGAGDRDKPLTMHMVGYNIATALINLIKALCDAETARISAAVGTKRAHLTSHAKFKRVQKEPISTLQRALDGHPLHVLDEQRAEEDDDGDEGPAGTYVYLQEKVMALHHLLQTRHSSSANVGELIENIRTLFPNSLSKADVVLSTTHRVAGLQFERVWQLEHRSVEEELQESESSNVFVSESMERNLQYVSVTRAKRSLFYVQLDGLHSGHA